MYYHDEKDDKFSAIDDLDISMILYTLPHLEASISTLLYVRKTTKKILVVVHWRTDWIQATENLFFCHFYS